MRSAACPMKTFQRRLAGDAGGPASSRGTPSPAGPNASPGHAQANQSPVQIPTRAAGKRRAPEPLSQDRGKAMRQHRAASPEAPLAPPATDGKGAPAAHQATPSRRRGSRPAEVRGRGLTERSARLCGRAIPTRPQKGALETGRPCPRATPQALSQELEAATPPGSAGAAQNGAARASPALRSARVATVAAAASPVAAPAATAQAPTAPAATNAMGVASSPKGPKPRSLFSRKAQPAAPAPAAPPPSLQPAPPHAAPHDPAAASAISLDASSGKREARTKAAPVATAPAGAAGRRDAACLRPAPGAAPTQLRTFGRRAWKSATIPTADAAAPAAAASEPAASAPGPARRAQPQREAAAAAASPARAPSPARRGPVTAASALQDLKGNGDDDRADDDETLVSESESESDGGGRSFFAPSTARNPHTGAVGATGSRTGLDVRKEPPVDSGARELEGDAPPQPPQPPAEAAAARAAPHRGPPPLQAPQRHTADHVACAADVAGAGPAARDASPAVPVSAAAPPPAAPLASSVSHPPPPAQPLPQSQSQPLGWELLLSAGSAPAALGSRPSRPIGRGRLPPSAAPGATVAASQQPERPQSGWQGNQSGGAHGGAGVAAGAAGQGPQAQGRGARVRFARGAEAGAGAGEGGGAGAAAAVAPAAAVARQAAAREAAAQSILEVTAAARRRRHEAQHTKRSTRSTAHEASAAARRLSPSTPRPPASQVSCPILSARSAFVASHSSPRAASYPSPPPPSLAPRHRRRRRPASCSRSWTTPRTPWTACEPPRPPPGPPPPRSGSRRCGPASGPLAVTPWLLLLLRRAAWRRWPAWSACWPRRAAERRSRKRGLFPRLAWQAARSEF
jgi:hypothetical protein